MQTSPKKNLLGMLVRDLFTGRMSSLSASQQCQSEMISQTREIRQEARMMLKNPRDAFRGHSRSPYMITFDMLGMVSVILWVVVF